MTKKKLEMKVSHPEIDILLDFIKEEGYKLREEEYYLENAIEKFEIDNRFDGLLSSFIDFVGNILKDSLKEVQNKLRPYRNFSNQEYLSSSSVFAYDNPELAKFGMFYRN